MPLMKLHAKSSNVELSHPRGRLHRCCPSKGLPQKRADAQANKHGDLIEDARVILREYLSRLGLKRSLQRDAILRTFLATRNHLSIEELHNLVKKDDPAIGYTTVYRTLKLFAQCGLAAEVEFHDGIIRYERRLHRRNHHHMVCTVCGSSAEFSSSEVEEIVQRIAKKFHYTPSRCTFQIYGTCDACKGKLQTPPSGGDLDRECNIAETDKQVRHGIAL